MRGCIKKRGKSWCMIVYLGRDSNRVKRYKWYTHPTRREAELHLSHLLTQLQGGGWMPPSRLLLGDFLQQWIQDYAVGAVASTTLDRYKSLFRIHLEPALGSIPVAKLTPQAIQAFLSQKLNEKVSPTTVQHIYRLLHEALGHGVRWGILLRNPTDAVVPPRRAKCEVRVWDEEQTKLFLGEAKRSSRFYPLYLAAALTGMRQGELLGLRWRDLDLALRVASIQQTFYRLGKQQLFKEPKTPRSRRAVALPEVLVAALQDVKERQNHYRSFYGRDYANHDLVFCQSNGQPLRANNIVRRDFRKVTERVGLPRIRFHDLRHGHATHLLRQGENPKVVQERLGHSSPAFTLHVYSHVLPGMQDQASRKLAERILAPDNDAGIRRP